MAKYLTPGRRTNRLPARSLNRAIDAGEAMHHMGPPAEQDPTPFRSDAPRLVVLVKNMTGVDLIERAIVGIKETALDLPDIVEPDGPDPGNLADQAVLIGEAVDVELPDPGKHTAGKWGVILGPIAAGEEGEEGHGWMAIGGLIKARVDVTSAAHAFAVPILNETEHLASADSGTPITWKKTGTGKKWSQINLGAGGGSGDPIVYGKLIATVPADSTLENAIELETYDGWFAPALDDDDEQILVHAGNPSLYSAYRGSPGAKVRVWGVMRTAEVSVDSELVEVPCFIIHGEFKDQVAASVGFVLAPDNDLGQTMGHVDGSAATVVDGAPCGGA